MTKKINIYVLLYTYILYVTSKSSQPNSIYFCVWELVECHELSLQSITSSRNSGYNWGFSISVFHEEIISFDICGINLRLGKSLECNMCRGLDYLQP